MQFSIAVLTATLAAVASASPLEARWFNTCNFNAQGTRTSAKQIATTVGAKAGSLTVGKQQVVLGSLTANGVTTTVAAFSADGSSQTVTYATAAGLINSIAKDQCTYLAGDFIEAQTALNFESQFVIYVYGNHKGN